jgi:hypothetical protein
MNNIYIITERLNKLGTALFLLSFRGVPKPISKQ